MSSGKVITSVFFLKFISGKHVGHSTLNLSKEVKSQWNILLFLVLKEKSQLSSCCIQCTKNNQKGFLNEKVMVLEKKVVQKGKKKNFKKNSKPITKQSNISCRLLRCLWSSKMIFRV